MDGSDGWAADADTTMANDTVKKKRRNMLEFPDKQAPAPVIFRLDLVLFEIESSFFLTMLMRVYFFRLEDCDFVVACSKGGSSSGA